MGFDLLLDGAAGVGVDADARLDGADLAGRRSLERPLDELGDRVESDATIEERGHGDLVRGVQDDRRAAAALERGPRQPQARELVGIGLEERQLTDAREIEPGRRRRPPFGYVSA